MSKLNFDYNLPGLEGCNSLTNGIVLDAYNLVIARCWSSLNETQKQLNAGATLTSVKFISDKSAYKLNAQDSLEYIKYNGNAEVNSAGRFWGPEDARLFEFKNELYLYYCMTNPKAQFPTRSMEFLKLDDIIKANNKPIRGKFLDTDVFGREPSVIEKNWLFIGNETDVLIVYSLKPFIFGDIVGSKFVARFQRLYPCLDKFGGVHFGSNAVIIDNNGKKELLFVFNDRSTLTTYISYFGFMEASAPFRLLRITKNPIKIEVEHSRLLYPSSITVKGKKHLKADMGDFIVVSGGVDDQFMFKKEISLKSILNEAFDDCSLCEESKYFSKPSLVPLINSTACTVPQIAKESTEICTSNDFHLVALGSTVVILILVILMLYVKRRNLDNYKRIHDA